MPDTVCVAERSVCALRATRLDPATCEPLTGPTDGMIAVAVMTANYTVNVTEGVRFAPVDGCGKLVYSAVQQDIINGGTLTFELGKEDFEGRELLTGAELILDGDGNTIGTSDRGPGSPDTDAVMLEVWTQTAYGSSQCSADGSAGWFRHIFPFNYARGADRTFENAAANQAYTSAVLPNPNWVDVWGDYPGVTDWNPNSPHVKVLDPAGPPAAVCGYVTPGGSGS